MRILVTGGAGYIGSHVARLLLGSGFRVSVLDDLTTGDTNRIHTLQREGGAAFRFHLCDIRDAAALSREVASVRPDTIIHLAGLKDVARSFAEPGAYQEINVAGTANLVAAATQHGVRRLVFSSSAAVYGDSGSRPACESDEPHPTSPYGVSKLDGEALFHKWACEAPDTRRAIVLRYFNPCASHPDLRPQRRRAPGETLSLSEIVAEVAEGKRPHLSIFGRNHPTADGLCRRDFVHIADIAEAHLSCVLRDPRRLRPTEIMNIGSGKHHSVLEFVDAFYRVTGIKVRHRFHAARPGDIAFSCADITRAAERLNWRPRYGLDDICRDLVLAKPGALRRVPIKPFHALQDAAAS